MTNKEFLALLSELNACGEAVQWVGERDLAAVWAECERAHWLLWLAGNMADKEGWPSRKEVILSAIECGRLSLAHAGKYENQLTEVFDVAQRCAENPTPENISAALSAADSAALSAADSAALSAADSAALSAAWSAAWSARGAAGSARGAAHKDMCAIIRKRLTIPGAEK